MTLSKTQQMYQDVVDLHSTHRNSQQEIAAVLGVTTRTVRNYLSMFRKGVPVNEVKEIGRPSKLTESVRRRMVAQLEQDPFSTSKQVACAVNSEETGGISDRSVRNFMKDLDYQYSLPRTVPFITDVQKVKRVHWAQAHRGFDWQTVLFSDETTIQLSANLSRAWHKRGRRPNLPRSKFPQKVMFWAAVSATRKSPLFAVEGTLNAQGYQGLLADYFLPWFRRQHIGRLQFQQDNAPPHTAKTTKRFFAEQNIDVLAWPASSPDLNPIENLWGILKVRVDRKKPSSKAELITVAVQEWNGIEMDVVRHCIESMPRRIEAVIEKNGEKIGY
jgi:transposase